MEQYLNKITCADCLDILKQLPDKSVDLVCTDCPYKIIGGGCKTGLYGGGDTKCDKKWMTAGQMQNYQNIKAGKMFKHNDIKFEDWLPEIYRVLKDGTHCYIMINGRNLAELQTKAESVGFIYQQLLVWEKGNATPNKFYLNGCEFILMLRKGGERWINNMGYKNILSVPNTIGDKCHPTEKPVGLMEILVGNSTNEGDIVLEPFAGSGSTCIAAKNLGRNFIGIELDEEYCKVANDRLINNKYQQTLF